MIGCTFKSFVSDNVVSVVKSDYANFFYRQGRKVLFAEIRNIRAVANFDPVEICPLFYIGKPVFLNGVFLIILLLNYRCHFKNFLLMVVSLFTEKR